MPALLDSIHAHVRTSLGGDVVPIPACEAAAVEAAVRATLPDYFDARPYEVWDSVESGYGDDAVERGLGVILDATIVDPTLRPLAYLTGVLSLQVDEQTDDAFALRLAGVPRGLTPRDADPYRADTLVLDATRRAEAIGDPHAAIDPVRGVVTFFTPNTVGHLDVAYGVGFAYGDAGQGLRAVAPADRGLFRRMVLLRVLDGLIMARGGLGLQADFAVNIEALSGLRERIAAEVDAELVSGAVVRPIWG